jgi:glycosyltransferase involved in cell wall biosynthesis
MRIAINAASLLAPLTGIGNYVKQLLVHLNRIDLEPVLFYSNYWDKQIRDAPLPSIEQIKKIKRAMFRLLPASYELLRGVQQLAFDRGVRETKPALYHEPNFLPFRFDNPVVITVHDISWMRYPKTHPIERVRIMNRHFPTALEMADRVIVVSEFVRRELIEALGVSAEKIVVTHLGVDVCFRPRPMNELAPVLIQYGLEASRYILTVGTLEPRKNLNLSLNAYKALPSTLKKNYPLVVVGMAGWREEQFSAELKRLRCRGEVILTGYVPMNHLPILYAGARLFVYPSLYEGFGLPPLEAMASGLPVIVSDRASLPEVGADAVVQVSAEDHMPLSEAMQRFIDDEKYSSEYANRGLRRAAQFTWRSCADKTLDVYKTLVGKGY